MDSDVNLKVIDDNNVTIHGNSNQTISDQLTHEQSTNTNPTQNTNIPSLLISKGQQEVRQSPSNDENGFENLFPSINFIQSLTGSDVKTCIDYSNLHWKTKKNRVAAEILTL